MTFAAPFLVTFYYFYLFFHKKWVLNIVYNCFIDFVLIYVLVLPSHNILNCKFFFCFIYFQEFLLKKKKKKKKKEMYLSFLWNEKVFSIWSVIKSKILMTLYATIYIFYFRVRSKKIYDTRLLKRNKGAQFIVKYYL